MPERKTWIVTLTGDRPVGEVRKALVAAGFNVEQVLEAIGSITGKGTAATAAKLRRIKGVADVAPDHAVGIGPPDSDTTW
jgi:hypothetical protein